MTTRVGRSLFELRLPGEAIIAASSHTTWNATLALARELGLKIQKADPVD